MTVSWYASKCWKLTPPAGSIFPMPWVVGTKITHTYDWEMWTLHKDDGTDIQVPQMVRHRYRRTETNGIRNIACAYDRQYDGVNETSFPDAALVRIEHDDGTPPPVDPADYYAILNTQAKWNNLYTQYPSLEGRFADQPAHT